MTAFQKAEFYIKDVHHVQLPKELQPGKEWDEPTLFFRFVAATSNAGTAPFEFDDVAVEDHKKRFPQAWNAFVLDHPEHATDEQKAAEVAASNVEAAESAPEPEPVPAPAVSDESQP